MDEIRTSAFVANHSLPRRSDIGMKFLRVGPHPAGRRWTLPGGIHPFAGAHAFCRDRNKVRSLPAHGEGGRKGERRSMDKRFSRVKALQDVFRLRRATECDQLTVSSKGVSPPAAAFNIRHDVPSCWAPALRVRRWTLPGGIHPSAQAHVLVPPKDRRKILGLYINAGKG